MSSNTLYSYVYHYKDHLGRAEHIENSRWLFLVNEPACREVQSYSFDPTTNDLAVLEEHHYYPFGLEHVTQIEWNIVPVAGPQGVKPTFTQVASNGYQYQYNGKEFQDELGLNMTAMDFRQYDNAIGRFVAMDRLSELIQFQTPYGFSYNNPNYWCDPSGLVGEAITDYYDDGKGNVIYDPNVHGPDDVPNGATYIGPTYTDPSTGTYWDENGNPHSAIQNLEEVVITSSKSRTSDPLFWINSGLGFSSLYFAYKSEYLTKSEFWHFDKKGKIHTILDENWNKAKNVRKFQSRKLQLPRNISNGLAIASIITSGYNVIDSGELKASDVLYTTMAGISLTGVGSIVAGVFFMADLATMGYTYIRDGESKSIGDILDENTNGGVLLNKNDFK